MGYIIKITREYLLGVVNRLPPEIALRDTDRTYFVAVAVLKLTFGPLWVEKNLDPSNGEGFLTHHFDRVLDLAELIYNLQCVDGFNNCVQQMLKGDVESAYAELDFGRMLYMHSQKFRYVTRSGKRGDDYDIEIMADDGVVICADAKCKIQAKEFNSESLANTSRDARTQFPKDKPSALFVKVPQHWLSTIEQGTALLNVARKFLRRTGRVTSVKLYVNQLQYDNGVVAHTQAFKEISNPNNRFDPKRDWDLFSKNVQGSPVPPIWKRLVNFPKDPSGLHPNARS
jgi:hypothetical protein